MVVATANDDGFQTPASHRKASNRKKVYIGNLPPNLPDLEQRLIELLKTEAGCLDLQPKDVTIRRNNNKCHAFVACSNSSIDSLIKNLNRRDFEGRKLIVQRERARESTSNRRNNSFGRSSWSKPTNHAPRNTDPQGEDIHIENFDEVTEVIGGIVEEEMDFAQERGIDPATAALVSTAAVTMMLGSLGGEQMAFQEPSVSPDAMETEGTLAPDFHSRLQETGMSSLLAEYGEQDNDWRKNQVDAIGGVPAASTEKPGTSNPVSHSRLGQHGKAPIHIEFVSFGYRNGAPVRNGWSHSLPLPPFDTRELPTVPHYLAWQDGLSGAVKRALLQAEGEFIVDFSNDAAGNASEAVVEAIDNGGHGYAMPLRVTIFIGSEQGRHRSVVATELAAKQMRNLLRANQGGRFGQPCSVGTRHRDVERKSNRPPATKAKQKEYEDEW